MAIYEEQHDKGAYGVPVGGARREKPKLSFPDSDADLRTAILNFRHNSGSKHDLGHSWNDADTARFLSAYQMVESDRANAARRVRDLNIQIENPQRI